MRVPVRCTRVASRRDELGAVAVFGVVMVVMAAVVMLGVARAGRAASAAARADTAADAAALAAAHALARNLGPGAAMGEARLAASDNHAVLRSCDCGEDYAEVIVLLDGATGRARAEVRTDCVIDPEGCDGS